MKIKELGYPLLKQLIFQKLPRLLSEQFYIFYAKNTERGRLGHSNIYKYLSFSMNRREIEHKARSILADHGLLDIPVDPLKVSKALGVRVMNARFSEPDKSGAVVKGESGALIYVSVDDSATRKRFSIAHELGHLALHMTDQREGEFVDTEQNFRSSIIDPDWNDERRKEWEANIFAAALLMDKELVEREWPKTRDLSKMAWKFQVSESAMAIRLSSLGIDTD